MLTGTPTEPSFMRRMEDTITSAVRGRIDEIVAEEIAAANGRVQTRLREAVAGMAIGVSRMVRMQEFGSELRITVQMEQLKKETK